MASRRGNDNTRYVVPNTERGGWDVIKENHQRASAHTARKADAEKRARQIVENLGGGEVQIRDERGRIVDSDTTRRSRESGARDTK